jgi:hypothetical protein
MGLFSNSRYFKQQKKDAKTCVGRESTIRDISKLARTIVTYKELTPGAHRR